MSPREFWALAERYLLREERADRRIAALQAFYTNCNLKEGATPVTIDDFMVGGKRKKKPKVTPDDMLEAQLTTMFGCGPLLEEKKKKKQKP